ncbi:hypothetical protein YpsIP31758_3365 [Yersinia pseudotuberculosis IP 31758]|uniref:Uncharacterized protein n=1 Tax=Yersinia pseudotuberculosis serotype O:1b (strain IP 31758) TaxID=349747 RepID=A0A0U1QUY0_YERP3|nr:hypothetical protein YpsIP31758_3365 [Yersinia pseudotuberculosis IP 31758]
MITSQYLYYHFAQKLDNQKKKQMQSFLLTTILSQTVACK